MQHNWTTATEPVSNNLLTVVQIYFVIYSIPVLNLKKTLKTSKVRILGFLRFFIYSVTNSIKMIFKYELRFVAFTWPNLCLLDLSLLFIVLVGRNFVSDMCKLKPKNLKTYFLLKNLSFFQPCRQVMMRKWDHLTKTLGRSLRSHQTEYAAYRSLSNMPTGRLVDCSSISLHLNTTQLLAHSSLSLCQNIAV